MKNAWIRRRPHRRETLAAGVVAGVLGLVTGAAAFYLARVLLTRDEISLEPPGPPGRGKGG